MSLLKDQTISGIKWNVIGQAISRPINIVVSIILANYIAPEEFGLIGMVMVFVVMAKQFSNFGFSNAIIFKQNEEPALLSTIFWFNMAGSTFFALLIISLSNPIANFYGEPTLNLVNMAIAITLVIESLNLVQNALLRKNLNFKALAFRESGGTIGGGVAGILAAISGLGVWAIIIQKYVGAILGVLLLWSQSKWRPSFYFSTRELKSVWKFGSNLMGFGILRFLSRNIDNLLIGKFIGAGDLGIYSRGYTFVTLPIHQISGVLQRVMFPAMSQIKDDHIKLKKVYLLTTQTIALFAFPSTIGLFVVAKPFVLGFLGDQWQDLVPILKMFSLVGMYQSIHSTTGIIFQTTGRTDKLFKWGMFSTSFTLLGFIAGILWGSIEAVAIAYTLVNLVILLPPGFLYPFKIINLSFKEFFNALAPILLISVLAGTVGFFTLQYFENILNSQALAIITILTSVVTYLSLLHFLRPGPFVGVIKELSVNHPSIEKYYRYLTGN